MTWSEAEYTEYLESERRCYAWAMRRYGDLTPAEAWQAALECYPYEPSDAPFRGLVFHDEAWHWAMLKIYGHRYARDHPELASLPAEYVLLDV
ncbi:hypothetical protein ACQB60_45570 [Actinomycetota bacterium Odt1-20B]